MNMMIYRRARCISPLSLTYISRYLSFTTIPLFQRPAKLKLPSDKIAIRTETHPEGYSYSQLLYDTDQFAHKLQNLLPDKTIDPSPRIAFWVLPGYEYVMVQNAIWRCGGVSVPLCVTHPAAELEYFLKDSQCSVLIGSEDAKNNVDLEKLANDCGVKYLSADKVTPLQLRNDSGSVLEEVEKRFRKVESVTDYIKDRPALIIYTSGTTGKPKGVVATHRSLQSQITTLVDAWEWSEKDHILNALPLHHIHGAINALLCGLWSGAQITFMKRFNAKQVWHHLVSTPDLNLWMAVPTMYAKLVEEFNKMSPSEQEKCKEACKRFRLMVSGSMALPDPLSHAWKDISGHVLLERYGMTETGMTLSNPLHGDRKPGYVGLPLPGVDLKVSNGELLVKGPSVFSGYWNKENATKESFDEEGYFITGDIVEIDADGYYKISGRSSVDILKSGGYKISALDIEKVLLEHPDIKECAVVGIPDPSYGQVIGVILSSKSGKLELTELQKWSEDKMAKYKIPRIMLSVESIPRNAMGKVNKKELVKLFK